MLKPIVVLFTLLVSAASSQQPAPASAAPVAAAAPAASTAAVAPVSLTNPVKATPASQAYAKKMYGYDCAMCHGANGDGKGEVGLSMKPAPKDFTDPATLKDVTDGAIFAAIKNGKGEMQGEGERLKTDDLWNMVILMRSFAKKQS